MWEDCGVVRMVEVCRGGCVWVWVTVQVGRGDEGTGVGVCIGFEHGLRCSCRCGNSHGLHPAAHIPRL